MNNFVNSTSSLGSAAASQPHLLSVVGRNALVTGAGQGVGRQAALHLAAHGATNVLVNDFHATRAEAVVTEIVAMGGSARAVVGDITDYRGWTRTLTAAIDAIGGLHIVVNNAGNAGPSDSLGALPAFWQTEPEEWDRWLGTNLYGVLNTCRIALPAMIDGKAGGSIVNIISDAGRVGEANLAVYSAAKAGASGFSRALAKAAGAHGIRVNAVSLASIRTPGLAELLSDEAMVARMLKQYVVRRLGEPSDAANMILFLASEAASWITGQTYAVNGGFSTSQ